MSSLTYIHLLLLLLATPLWFIQHVTPEIQSYPHPLNHHNLPRVARNHRLLNLGNLCRSLVTQTQQAPSLVLPVEQ